MDLRGGSRRMKSRRDLALMSVSKLAYVNVYTCVYICLILEHKCTVNYTVREMYLGFLFHLTVIQATS